ncbi:4Fe-4S dicluster domain-containing protein [Desulforhopalus singaporensis]|uniref:Prokaryotic molybdopterin-containing oxidoreductase family, iron-sulfur binding subunit n=1 Tax=Desulforhopalus singaporensis TaxID=91360 RepID=A0A1H0T7L3_9BACT|nr:4Fe-4S dicluster domain-containing protein [Desulforhopalus singaporensis]SDP50042.1 prokaryotic molybdopterin-containing oxidoreductase family, iron-sulfur binding subunit [Desulforhopalus singaporensis]
MSAKKTEYGEDQDLLMKKSDRRTFLKGCSVAAAAASAALTSGCIPSVAAENSEEMKLRWQEFFKKNYRLMTQEEKDATVARLERLAKLRDGLDVQMGSYPPLKGVLYGYGFNITRCEGFMECVAACVKENNLDRKTNTQYIRIFEMEPGKLDPGTGDGQYYHKVPVENKFYMGTQCFHCENAPCTKACPTKATWREPDGIVVVDYDWCIGCRYCQAACPYYGRRFNWGKPEIPRQEINLRQHYLGNRVRPKGKMEKCTFCIQRTRKGRLPACVEACPTGARVFGNLLDPDSEIRYVLKHKKVFRMKEELGTDPKFWYFID